METLLTRILNAAEKKKLMFRVNAHYLWNWDCEEYIKDYSYNQDDIKSVLRAVETEDWNIHFMPESEVISYEDALDCYYFIERDLFEEHWEGNLTLEEFDEVFDYWNPHKVGKYPRAGYKYSLHLAIANEIYNGDNHLRMAWDCWEEAENCYGGSTDELEKLLDVRPIIDQYKKDIEIIKSGF